MDKKETIINAARETFAAKGYHGACMDEIAESAGVAKGTLYLYFTNKEELFATVIMRLLAKTEEWVEIAENLEAGTWEKIETMVKTALDYFSRNKEVFSILQRETPLQTLPSEQDMGKQIKDLMRSRVERLARFFAAQRKEGGISDSFTDREAAFLCLNVVEGIVRRFLEGWEEDTEKNAMLAVRFLKNGLSR